jgi:hypothetical protein
MVGVKKAAPLSRNTPIAMARVTNQHKKKQDLLRNCCQARIAWYKYKPFQSTFSSSHLIGSFFGIGQRALSRGQKRKKSFGVLVFYPMRSAITSCQGNFHAL